MTWAGKRPACWSTARGRRGPCRRGIQKSRRCTGRSASRCSSRAAWAAGLSRHQAIKLSAGADVRDRLRKQGVLVFSLSSQGLKEEIPEAYKDVDDVVAATVAGGISEKVARLRPLVVIKG
ncbi:MAG: RtcB family protein [Candidatus Aminicenantes bacterium]|nr:RtcB family protein [Candidatus Aminicenantes bacterium]